MWLKQCHKPPILEWFIPPIYDDLGDDLLLFYPQYEGFRTPYHPNFEHDFVLKAMVTTGDPSWLKKPPGVIINIIVFMFFWDDYIMAGLPW